jgi:DNA-binding transcriptional MocR family regulator
MVCPFSGATSLFGGRPLMSDTWLARMGREVTNGNLTDTEGRCLRILMSFRGHGGALFPSHESIAARARRSVSTVQRALSAARDLGLLRWAERRVRSGWRWLRTSNAYELLEPENPMKTTTGQPDRGTLRVKESSYLSVVRGVSRKEKEAREGHRAEVEGMIQAAAGLPDLLEQRNAVTRARQAAQWARRHAWSRVT